MNDVGVIDRFLDVFSRYIDSGFGLLSGEVAFLATTLIVIDVTLAACSGRGRRTTTCSRARQEDAVRWRVRLHHRQLERPRPDHLRELRRARAAGLGGTVSAADFVRPGRIAQVGIEAGRPILESISDLMGFVSFFENFIQIAILLFAWVLVILSFFILAIQLFVTLIEFKLTTLAGFVLIPFGLFGKTAFLAERVLGNVISSGVKVLVLAVIVGIGSTLFSEFTAGLNGAEPTIEDALAIVLAALSLLGLGIYGPGVANGIVSGGPQLSAGSAVGAGLAAGGVVAAGYGAARMSAGAVAGMAGGGRTAAATTVPPTRGSSGTGDGAPSGRAPSGGVPGGGASVRPISVPQVGPASPLVGSKEECDELGPGRNRRKRDQRSGAFR
jgi:type IV secretion system protein TrbL